MDLQDSLQGNMREIIGTLSLKDISTNRDEFGNQVQEKASTDMRKLGIEIISRPKQIGISRSGRRTLINRPMMPGLLQIW